MRRLTLYLPCCGDFQTKLHFQIPHMLLKVIWCLLKVSVIFDNIFSFYRDKSKEKKTFSAKDWVLVTKYRQTSIRYYIPNTDPMGSNLQPATSVLSFRNASWEKDLPWNPAAACMTRDTLYWSKGWTEKRGYDAWNEEGKRAVTERQVKISGEYCHLTLVTALSGPRCGLATVSAVGKHSVIACFEDSNSDGANRTLFPRMTVLERDWENTQMNKGISKQRFRQHFNYQFNAWFTNIKL